MGYWVQVDTVRGLPQAGSSYQARDTAANTAQDKTNQCENTSIVSHLCHLYVSMHVYGVFVMHHLERPGPYDLLTALDSLGHMCVDSVDVLALGVTSASSSEA